MWTKTICVAAVGAVLFYAALSSHNNAAASAAEIEESEQVPVSTVTGSVSGHVYRGDTNKPVEGAIITLSSAFLGGLGSPPPQPSPAARTGADGAYIFKSVDPGRYRVEVEEAFDRFAPPVDNGRSVDVAAGQNSQNVDLRVRTVGAISGNVSDEYGDPIRGLPVGVYCLHDDAGHKEFELAGGSWTDDRGDYRVASLPPGACKVAVSSVLPLSGPPDRATFYPAVDSMKDAPLVEIKPEEDTSNLGFRIPLALAETAGPPAVEQLGKVESLGRSSISGRVYRADTGAPVAGAIVYLGSSALHSLRPPGDRIFTVAKSFDIPDLPRRAVRSGADGSFVFDSLEPGTYLVHAEQYGYVLARSPSGAPLGPIEEFIDSGKQRLEKIDIRLQPAGAISGVVLDQDGVPLQNMLVRFFSAGSSSTSGRPVGKGNEFTDDRGYFRKAGLAAGEYFVGAGPNVAGDSFSQLGYRVAFSGADSSRAFGRAVSVKPQSERTDIHLVVPRAPTFTITVKAVGDTKADSTSRYDVRFTPDDPAAGRTAAMFRLGPGSARMTDAEGTVRLRGILPGSYTIQVNPTRMKMYSDGRSWQWTADHQFAGSAAVKVVDADINLEIPVTRVQASQTGH